MTIENILTELDTTPEPQPPIDTILVQTGMHQLERAQLNKEQLERARATVEQIAEVMSDYRTAVSHIMSDGRLSKDGKQTDLGTAKEKADERLAHIGDDRLEALDTRIAELEYETRPQEADTDDIIELLKQQEVRTLIKAHPEYSDELQLRAYYTGLATTGVNDLFMRAVEESPLPLITDPSIIEAGKRARGERTNADAARTLKQLRTIRKTIKDALDTARGELNLPDLTLQNIAEGTAT